MNSISRTNLVLYSPHKLLNSTDFFGHKRPFAKVSSAKNAKSGHSQKFVLARNARIGHSRKFIPKISRFIFTRESFFL